MVKMDNCYISQDRIYNLWHEIDKCHLSYLQLEESQEKIEQRNKLEDFICDYLCLAAHSQKFTFHETAEVLQRSASSKKDFSGYKAATGFNAIQMYSGNLLSQPWRQEYRQIKTYCGFYKHQIEANLIGAERMFETMGYKHTGDGVLILEGPICPDRVAAVSKDCLIAYVECQIMKAVWEEISSASKITWLEVWESRKQHQGSPEEVVRAMQYRHQHNKYHEHGRSFSHGSDSFSNGRCQTMAVPALNHSFPPPSSHHHVGLPAAPALHPFVYPNGCCASANPYATYGSVYGHPTHHNGYFYANGYAGNVPVPLGYGYPVPTGQLIEVEPQSQYDVVDKGTSLSNLSLRNKADERRNDAAKEEDSQYKDWEFVFRSLEKKGISKDVGERGDLLSPDSKRNGLVSKEKKASLSNLDEVMNSLSLNDRFDRAKKIDSRERERKSCDRLSLESCYDNLEPVKKGLNEVNYASVVKTLPRERNAVPDKYAQSKTLDTKKLKEEKSNKEKAGVSKAWQCKACTFLNENVSDICEMCGKSRAAVTEQPMEIGGAECSKCTLVNPKNMKKCQACSNDLKNSPTYI